MTRAPRRSSRKDGVQTRSKTARVAHAAQSGTTDASVNNVQRLIASHLSLRNRIRYAAASSGLRAALPERDTQHVAAQIIQRAWRTTPGKIRVKFVSADKPRRARHGYYMVQMRPEDTTLALYKKIARILRPDVYSHAFNRWLRPDLVMIGGIWFARPDQPGRFLVANDWPLSEVGIRDGDRLFVASTLSGGPKFQFDGRMTQLVGPRSGRTLNISGRPFPRMSFTIEQSPGNSAPGRVLRWTPDVHPDAAFYLDNEVFTGDRGQRTITQVYSLSSLLDLLYIAERREDGGHAYFSPVPRAVAGAGAGRAPSTLFAAHNIRMLSYNAVRRAQEVAGNTSAKASNYLLRNM